MTKERLPWEIRGSYPWKLIVSLKLELEKLGGKIYDTDNQVEDALSKVIVEEYLLEFYSQDEFEKVYLAKIPQPHDTGEQYIIKRDWIDRTINARDLDVGDVIETGWTTVVQRKPIGNRLYYVVLSDNQGNNVFVRFARREVFRG